MEDVALTFWGTIGNGWSWYWTTTKNYAISTGVVMMMITASYIMFCSLRFNYHYYIKHGKFALFCEGDSEPEYKIRINSVAEELNIQSNCIFLPWVQAFIATVIVCVVIFLLSLIWPITSIAILPLVVIRLIAYRKRRRIAFLQKLEGKND